MTAELLSLIRHDRFRAHDLLFAHRHEYPFADFHRLLVEDFWSPERFYIDLGFRECGKTTLVEEGITIGALEGAFRNCLIIGARVELAAELLLNIKSELENNEMLETIWGDQRGVKWTENKIELRDGRCIQARGVGQRVRGTAHRNMRPDLVVVNDFEDDEDLLNPDGRRKALRWFLKILLPACDRARRKIRIYDTVRDADSVPMMLIKRQKWPHRMIPICYRDESGQERSSWPGHPTLTEEWIASERRLYRELGEEDIFLREYMCEATAQADRTFTADMLKLTPVEHTFQGKWVAIDPARSVGRSSAFTGWAVWSWERHRLVVWECGAKHMMPSEVVDLAFRLNREHQPVEIGIEENGLNQWLLEPIRARVARDGAIPYRSLWAPKGQTDFIKGLQPFFAAGQVALTAEMPELREQLLGFPTGRRDAANALAYSLQLRPGRLIYENFNPATHIAPAGDAGANLYLAANATRAMVAGVLVRVDDGRIACLADWVVDGDPGEASESLIRSASMFAGRGLTAIAGPRHFDQWQNVGLVQAFREAGVQCRPGGSAEAGRAVIRRELERLSGGEAGISISPEAQWTLRAFSGGYARPTRDGRVADEAEPNRYRVLIEGLESLAGLFQWGLREDEERNYAIGKDGRRYLSIMPQQQPELELKSYG